MERISEKFNQKYPDDLIAVYVKTEDGDADGTPIIFTLI